MWQKKIFLCAVFAAIFFMIPLYAFAAPMVLNYQGKLMDPSGTALTGVHTIEFSLFDNETGGSPLWSETLSLTADSKGVFEAQLGAVTPFTASIFSDDTLYLELEVETQTLTPRQKIASSAFAINTNYLGGNNAAYFQKRVSGTCVAGSSIRAISADGTVTCQTDTDTNTTYTAGTGLSLSSGAFYVTPGGITSTLIQDGTIDTVDIAMNAVNTSQIADNAITTAKIAVDTITSADIAANAISISEIADNAVATTKIADNAVATAKIANTAVTGAKIASSSITTSHLAAGNFTINGNLHVTGTLSKITGSFRIDHPLDPENKYLYHSFVESPDMMNVYNGNAMLDGNGEAVIQLPDWFEALNKDFRYQLTAIGAPAPNLYVAQEVQQNRFKIAGGPAGAKVSWQVTGIRHDTYAEANRIPVEQLKKAQ